MFENIYDEDLKDHYKEKLRAEKAIRFYDFFRLNYFFSRVPSNWGLFIKKADKKREGLCNILWVINEEVNDLL